MIDDLLAEYRELAQLCESLKPADWQRRSAFYGWTAWDEIAHLCYFDEAALTSCTEPARFAHEAQALGQRTAAGEEISAIARAAYGHLDGPALLAHWRPRFESLAMTLGAMDLKARLNWYGPPMSARSFISARLMETWAHGQDVWDLMRQRRPGNARLKHIAHLGVSTFGWSFVNRGLPVPEAAPCVRLTAPATAASTVGSGASRVAGAGASVSTSGGSDSASGSGSGSGSDTGTGTGTGIDDAEWIWGDPASPHHVSGSALDFCLLVTQRRHVADTDLVYSPGAVAQWLAIAQCFAGAPASGPAPGERQVVYA